MKSLRDNVLPAATAILCFSFFLLTTVWSPGDVSEQATRGGSVPTLGPNVSGPISGPLEIPTDMKRDRIALPEFRGKDRAEVEDAITPVPAPRDDVALQLAALRVATVAFAAPTDMAIEITAPNAPGFLEPYRISSASASSGGWLGDGRKSRSGDRPAGTSLGPITGTGRGIGVRGIGGGGGGAGCAAPPGGR